MNFQKYIVKQKDLTDSGAACLLMLIKYYRGNNSIDNILNLSGTNLDVTTLLGMYETANNLGFKAHCCSADLKSIQKLETPLILHLTINNKEHFVVLFDYNAANDQFIIGDPALGLVIYNSEDLLKVWKSETCLIVKKNDQFEKLNTHYNGIQHKLKWIFKVA